MTLQNSATGFLASHGPASSEPLLEQATALLLEHLQERANRCGQPVRYTERIESSGTMLMKHITDKLSTVMENRAGEQLPLNGRELISGIQKTIYEHRPYEAGWIASTLNDLFIGVRDKSRSPSDGPSSFLSVADVDRCLSLLEDSLVFEVDKEDREYSWHRFTVEMLASSLPSHFSIQDKRLFVGTAEFPTWAAPRDGVAISEDERIRSDDPDATVSLTRDSKEDGLTEICFLGYDALLATADIGGFPFVLGLHTCPAGWELAELSTTAVELALTTAPDITGVTVELSPDLQPNAFRDAFAGYNPRIGRIPVTYVDRPSQAQTAIADIKAHGGLHSGSCRRPGHTAHHLAALAAAAEHNRRMGMLLQRQPRRKAA